MASQLVLMGFAFYTVYAVQNQGVSEVGVGWMTGILLGVSIVANILMGALGDRWGHRYLMEFGLIAGIDVILDMGRTCLNVTGDVLCTTAVAYSEGEFSTDTAFPRPAAQQG